MDETERIERKPAGERHLRCQLTQEEFNQAADELANALSRKTEAESEMQSIREQMKAKITGIEADITRLQPVVSQRADYRKVKCEKVLNFTRGVVQIERLDTGEVVEKRLMFEDEKQQQLALDAEAAEAAEDAEDDGVDGLDAPILPDAGDMVDGNDGAPATAEATEGTDSADTAEPTEADYKAIIAELVFDKERAEREYGGSLKKHWYKDAATLGDIDVQYRIQTAKEMGGTAKANRASASHNPFDAETDAEARAAWAEGWTAVQVAQAKLQEMESGGEQAAA